MRWQRPNRPHSIGEIPLGIVAAGEAFLESRKAIATHLPSSIRTLMLEFDLPAQTAAVRSVLANHGIRRALALLNDRTPYRYTAIYKLIGETMEAVHVFDRGAEYRSWLKAVPLDKRFCEFAIREGEVAIHHASMDQRLVSPYDGLVESCYVRLLKREDGTLYGSFIHFDVEPRRIAQEEVTFLQDVIPLFLDYLD